MFSMYQLTRTLLFFHFKIFIIAFSSRNPVEDIEGSSEGSSNSRLEKLPNHAMTLQNAVDSSVSELNRISLRDQSIAGSLSSGGTEINNPQGRLLFEYLEYEPPFGREPLANKVKFPPKQIHLFSLSTFNIFYKVFIQQVSDLASKFPELMTYRSCDLSPSSWVSVSWYVLC